MSSCNNANHSPKVKEYDFVARYNEVIDSTDTTRSFNSTNTEIKYLPTHFKSIQDVMSDTLGTLWGYYMDSCSVLHLNSEKGHLLLQYYTQCWGDYPIKIQNNKIIVFWNNSVDCVFDIFPHSVADNIKKPKAGKPFMILSLNNDTTLKAEYIYPEWIQKVNQHIQTLCTFPQQFVRITVDNKNISSRSRR